MSTQAGTSQDYEQQLLDIARTLPPGRAQQLLDFARFLEAQLLTELLLAGEEPADVEADNARWDALLDSDDGQSLLERLAAEALAAHQAGKSTAVSFDDQGRIRPV